MVDVKWVWAFLDTPAEQADQAWEFWRRVTRSRLSPRRGRDGEFVTFLPESGGSWLKGQAVGSRAGAAVPQGYSGSRVHLDFDVVDPLTAAQEAMELGALRTAPVAGAEPPEMTGFVTLESPGGQPFCLTTWAGPGDRHVRGGQPDLLDQVCLDLPGEVHEGEIAFWQSLTGWSWQPSDVAEFSYLVRPAEQPLRLLFQRLVEGEGPVGAHVDLACVDRSQTQAAHVAWGAEVVDERAFWTVLRDPVGRVYCLTDRTPTQGWVGA